jgi:hypothetical protein
MTAESHNSETKKKKAAVAMQWCGKHVSAATNKHAAIEEPLKQCFLCSPC